jgi:hypothetical protein
MNNYVFGFFLAVISASTALAEDLGPSRADCVAFIYKYQDCMENPRCFLTQEYLDKRHACDSAYDLVDEALRAIDIAEEKYGKKPDRLI